MVTKLFCLVRLAALVSMSFMAALSPANAQLHARPGTTYQLSSDSTGGLDSDDCALLNVCGGWYKPAGREIQAGVLIGANFNLGVVKGNSIKSASAWVDSRFRVAPGENRTVTAQISGTVEWLGILFGGGLGQAKPSVKIEASLYDETAGNPVHGVVVHENTCQDLILISACSFTDRNSRPLTLQADVIRGHTYRIRLQVTCHANAGVLGVDVGCIYMANDLGKFGEDGYVKHSAYTLTIGDDIVELLKNLKATVQQLQEQVEELNETTRVIKARQLDSIRLQHTPNGRRSTGIPACNGAPCSWPDNNGWRED